jgi:hypothetical protein
MHFLFFAWLREQYDHARYRTPDRPPSDPDKSWQILGIVPYRDTLLRRRNCYAIMRAPAVTVR